MAIVQQPALSLCPSNTRTLRRSPSAFIVSSSLGSSLSPNQNLGCKSLQLKLKRRGLGRCSCFFSGDRKKEQARLALEGALGEKKGEFERWNKEIEKRELDNGGASGGGGWFGWGGWGGGSGDHFWYEAKQASIVILGFVFMYLILAKGDVMLAVIFNPLLFSLRWTRELMTNLWSLISGKVSPARPIAAPVETEELATRLSAKESVIRKWGSE